MVQAYSNYGRVACFKGIDAESFAFNTSADPILFDQQFELFRRFLELEIDLFTYVTFTTPNIDSAESSLCTFVDRLQRIHPRLPLRTVPLEVLPFTPVEGRLRDEHRAALENQYAVARSWHDELARRFKPDLLNANICDLRLKLK